MHPLHAPILIVLLLIPNTTWRDWQSAPLPRLHQILSTAAIGLMNARTAETDTITPEAGLRTILAGARMSATPDTAKLDYPVRPDNLASSLETAGIRMTPVDPGSAKVIGSDAGLLTGSHGALVVEQLPGMGAAQDAEIERRRLEVAASGDRGALVIASPSPSASEYADFDQLTPVAVWQPGSKSALLYSSSTRHAGLIANTDLAPTLAALAGVELTGPVYGAPLSFRPANSAEAAARLSEMSRKTQDQANSQQIVPFIAIAIAIFVLAVGLKQFSGSRKEQTVQASKFDVATAFVAPGLGIMMLFATTVIGLAVPALVLLFATVAATSLRSGSEPRGEKWRLALLVGIATLFILGNAAFGHGSWMEYSLLGYSYSDGARYYGLGNEAMGVVIGAAVLASGLLLRPRYGMAFGAVLWLVVALLLGIPTLGAKAGGALVASVALVAYLYAAGSRPLRSLRPAAVAGMLLAAVAAAIVGLVVAGRFGNSHVTQTVSMAQQHGAVVIASVIQRKLAMDLHLMLHSAWMLVLLACCFGLYVMSRPIASRRANDPAARSVLITGITATAACLVLNDAGVVAAALCSLLVWAYLILALPSEAAASSVSAD